MSMISSQCDKLRDTAMRVEIFLEGSTDAIPMDTHKQLRDAADTIWELRCKLVDIVDQREEVEQLKAENVKLRKLIGAYHEYCLCKKKSAHQLITEIEDMICELGIETNDD